MMSDDAIHTQVDSTNRRTPLFSNRSAVHETVTVQPLYKGISHMAIMLQASCTGSARIF